MCPGRIFPFSILTISLKLLKDSPSCCAPEKYVTFCRGGDKGDGGVKGEGEGEGGKGGLDIEEGKAEEKAEEKKKTKETGGDGGGERGEKRRKRRRWGEGMRGRRKRMRRKG